MSSSESSKCANSSKSIEAGFAIPASDLIGRAEKSEVQKPSRVSSQTAQRQAANAYVVKRKRMGRAASVRQITEYTEHDSGSVQPGDLDFRRRNFSSLPVPVRQPLRTSFVDNVPDIKARPPSHVKVSIARCSPNSSASWVRSSPHTSTRTIALVPQSRDQILDRGTTLPIFNGETIQEARVRRHLSLARQLASADKTNRGARPSVWSVWNPTAQAAKSTESTAVVPVPSTGVRTLIRPEGQRRQQCQRLIGVSTGDTLQRLLQNDGCLRSLNLSWLSIGSHRDHLLQALKDNTTVTELKLGHSDQIDTTTSRQIGNLLALSRTLRHLCLFDGQLRDDSATHVVRGLHSNSVLMSLNLGGNRISDAGATEVAHMLAANSCLTTLRLHGNCIADAGVEQIVRACAAKEGALGTLHLGYNKISLQAAAKFADIPAGNSTLTSLHLGGNLLKLMSSAGGEGGSLNDGECAAALSKVTSRWPLVFG